jgi:hypothetical protein
MPHGALAATNLWAARLLRAYFLAGAAEPPPRMALKNSLLGSSTITSDFLLNVDLYASMLW